MPDPKLYFSWLQLADGSKKYVKDAEAREDIAAIQEILQNGSRYIGKFTSAVVGGETVTTLKDGDVVTSITTSTGTYVTGTPAGTEKQLMAGDYCQHEVSGKSTTEWMWNGSSIDEFGSTSLLKALAFKDSASGSYTPAGTNAPSAVTFTGQEDGDFVTGFDVDPVLPSFTEGAFDAGSLPSFTEGAFTPASWASGAYSAGVAPSFTEGAFDAGSLPSFTEGAFDAGSLPSKEADTFSAGTLPTKAADTFDGGALPTMTYDSTNEGIVFAAGSLPTFTEGAFTQGSLPSFTEGAFDAGSLPSKGADTFSAGTLPSKQSDSFNAGSVTTLDLTKFDGGSKAADTFSAGSLPSKAADTFNAGTAPTLATDKAITNVGTGEAAAQTFTGTEGTVTVS